MPHAANASLDLFSFEPCVETRPETMEGQVSENGLGVEAMDIDHKAHPALLEKAEPAEEHGNRNVGLPAPPKVEHLKGKAARRNKKKKNTMEPGAPAKTVLRGFETPILSAAEDSDASSTGTPRLSSLVTTPPSIANSPSLRPSNLTRAMSGLKLGETGRSRSGSGSLCAERKTSAEDHQNLARWSTGSGASMASEENSDMETVNFPIDRDLADEQPRHRALMRAVEGGLRLDSPHRKMTAEDFEPLKCLGKGAFGTVLLVKQHATGRLFAQKQLKKATLTVRKALIEQAKSERAILESVNRHPFVVKLYYAFQDHHKLYLILEYAQGGELFHHLKMERALSEETSAFYMAEMTLALDYLHTHLGVVYRDLKPENCLLDAEGHLLLTDFGLSKVALEEGNATSDGGSNCGSLVGTVDYMAPEVIQGKPYTAAVDWWSLGALGFDLLTGAPPFSANNYTKIQQKILHSKPAFPYYLSPDAKDLLTRLLRKEPRKRLGGNMPGDLITIKKHRFFRRVDWRALENRELTPPIQPIITDPAEAENFSTEFTELAMSPVDTRSGKFASADDPFGGFSYVASSSLLEANAF